MIIHNQTNEQRRPTETNKNRAHSPVRRPFPNSRSFWRAIHAAVASRSRAVDTRYDQPSAANNRAHPTASAAPSLYNRYKTVAPVNYPISPPPRIYRVPCCLTVTALTIAEWVTAIGGRRCLVVSECHPCAARALSKFTVKQYPFGIAAINDSLLFYTFRS